MKIFIFIFIFFSLDSFARIISSPRGDLMGDAYTAMANDEFSLFYNPATLARHRGFSFHPINPKFSAINPLAVETDKFKDLDDDSVSQQFDKLSATPIHGGIDYAPGFKMGKFGLNVIVSERADIMVLNRVSPRIFVNEKKDRGFIMGYGLPLSGSFNEKRGGGEQISMGISVKYIERRGVDNSYALTSPTILDLKDAEDIDDFFKKLGEAEGFGWGADIGFEWIKKRGGTTLSAGLSFLDPQTKINKKKDDTGLDVPQEYFRTNLGFGFIQELGGGLFYSLSSDIQEINNTEMDFRRKLKVGFEIGSKPISVLAGFNGGYYSYGTSLHLGIVDLFAGFYDVEAGTEYQQLKSNRFLIYLSLFDFKFDA